MILGRIHPKPQAMNTQEALADAAELIRSIQSIRQCGDRGTEEYCPVMVIGGSYPGFLAAMMRMRYPAVVDMAYASSAPLKFYSQQVSQYDYYAKVTESAERSTKGCPEAVKAAFNKMVEFFRTANTSQIAEQFSVCEPIQAPAALPDNLLFLAEQTFANLNMANYPPNSGTGRTYFFVMNANPHKSRGVKSAPQVVLTDGPGVQPIQSEYA